MKRLSESRPNTISEITSISSTLNEGKELIGLLKDFISTQFPSGKKESEWPRKKMVELMKWYVKLVSEWTELNVKFGIQLPDQ